MTHINALISLKAHFAYYGILAHAKCKNCYGMNNLLAKRHSVARTDSILGLPVFGTYWIRSKFAIYTPKQEAKFPRPFSCRSPHPLTRVLDLINLMKP